MADENTVCFCLSWNDHVDLDIHCVMPDGKMCFFGDKKPTNYICLDVDKQETDFGSQVENMILEAKNCLDGKYRFYVRYFSGMTGRSTPFTFVVNQFNQKINEGVSISCKIKKDLDCVTITMKEGKVVEANFHLPTNTIPVN